MYRSGNYVGFIEKVEVTKFSDKSVWMYNSHKEKEQREGRFTHYWSYWETFKDAKQHLVDINKEKVKTIERQLIYAKTELNTVLNLNE